MESPSSPRKIMYELCFFPYLCIFIDFGEWDDFGEKHTELDTWMIPSFQRHIRHYKRHKIGSKSNRHPGFCLLLPSDPFFFRNLWEVFKSLSPKTNQFLPTQCCTSHFYHVNPHFCKFKVRRIGYLGFISYLLFLLGRTKAEFQPTKNCHATKYVYIRTNIHTCIHAYMLYAYIHTYIHAYIHT